MTPRLFHLLEKQLLKYLQHQGFKRRMVEVDGTWTHYLEAQGQGDLPTLVMLHGISANAVELARTYLPLKQHFSRILSIDLPGHGHSGTPPGGMQVGQVIETFCKTLDYIGGSEMIVFGNSLGGSAALKYANHSPERVKALILSSPGGAQLNEPDWEEFRARFSNRNQAEALAFMKLLYQQVPWYGPLMAPYVRHRFHQPAIQELLASLSPTDLLQPDELRNLSMPTLLIWGGDDRLMVNHLDFFKEHLPAGAVLDEPPHFTHCPYLENPLEVAEKIEGFARQAVQGEVLREKMAV